MFGILDDEIMGVWKVFPELDKMKDFIDNIYGKVNLKLKEITEVPTFRRTVLKPHGCSMSEMECSTNEPFSL